MLFRKIIYVYSDNHTKHISISCKQNAELILKGSGDGVQHSGLLGFWTLSIVRYSKEYDVSETGPVSVPWRHLLDPLERANLNNWPTSSPEDGNRSSFRYDMFFRIPDDGQTPKVQ
jgi:hypothetical protein